MAIAMIVAAVDPTAGDSYSLGIDELSYQRIQALSRDQKLQAAITVLENLKRQGLGVQWQPSNPTDPVVDVFPSYPANNFFGG
jgi:hypothetical protein